MSAPDAVAVPPVRATPGRVPRFTRAQRVSHWVNATLWGVALITAAYFKFGWGQSLVHDRELVRNVHVIFGLGIIAAFAVSVMGRYGAALRQDLRRFNRWSPDDVRWMRTLGKSGNAKLGKFNPGQKLNAIFVGATALILGATGSIMKWNKPFSTDLRTGADFVHGWFALFITITIVGHIMFALRDRESLGSMVSGDVSTTWANHHRPIWAAEVTREPVVTPDGNAREPEQLDA